jgi:hypothetical protein
MFDTILKRNLIHITYSSALYICAVILFDRHTALSAVD